MTPEEKFNKDVLFVFNKIKEKLPYSKINAPIEYEIKFYGNEELYKGTASSPENEESVLYKLDELGAFKILDKNELPSQFHVEAIIFNLKINELKFEEIYNNYYSNKGWPKSTPIDEEIVRIQKVSTLSDHIFIRDNWIATKSILDLIYKSLSPLEYGTQTTSIDPRILSVLQKNILKGVLKNMLAAHVATFETSKSQAVISNVPVIKFLNGEGIVIPNRHAFEDYRQKILKLCVFIEDDGKARFPTAYENPKKAEEVLAKKDVRFPHKIPRGTKWENFIIKFIDNEKISIKVAGKNYETSFQELGLEDKRNGKPDSQWSLLVVLAKSGGEISWKSPEASEKFKKWTERLANRFREYFGIDYDPFYPYKETKSYKIKLTLIPPPETRGSGVIKKQDTGDEVQEMFDDLITSKTE